MLTVGLKFSPGKLKIDIKNQSLFKNPNYFNKKTSLQNTLAN